MSKITITLDTFEVQIIKALLDCRIEEVKKELSKFKPKSMLDFEDQIIRDALNSLMTVANKVEAAQLADQMKGEKKS
jgi:hypothetical protein